MSRLVLTNKESYFEDLYQMNKKHGLVESGVKKDSILFINYKKIKVNNYNYCTIGNDFIASSGTFVYKGMMGEKAFLSLYEDYCRNDIVYIRKKLIGTYALVIKKGKKIIVFIDESGNYALYYYKNKDCYLVTNLMYHIGVATKTKIDSLTLLEELNEYCILDNRTLFKDTLRLMADEAIEIDLDKNQFNVLNIECSHYNLNARSFEDIADIISSTIIRYAKLQTLMSNTKVLYMTGGMDSRLTLAGDIAAGYLPKLANWQGSPVYMNTKIEDKYLCKQIAETMGLAFEFIDVSEEVPHEISISDFERIGEYACIYGNNSNWHNYFCKTNEILFDFGYFGETVKGWTPLELDYHLDFTIINYADLYLNRQKHLYADYNNKLFNLYRNEIINKLKKICIKYRLNENSLSKEDCMFLYYIYRTHADTKMVNFANIYGYSFNLYAQKELIDYINQTPYKYKQEGKLNLALTKKLCPNLMELPYFSHCHYINYDNKKMILEDHQLNSLSSKIKRIVPRNLKKIIKKVIGKEETSLKEINELIKFFSLNNIYVEWLPRVDNNTYNSVGEYKSYYDYYTMLKGLHK